MKHASLFTGIGGFDLASQWMGWENVFQVEWDKDCQKLLKQNFEGVDLYGNIDEFDGTRYTGLIDVLSGGPPCQPASIAGKRKGEKDDRWKWPEAIRVFGEIRPLVGVFENPAGLLSLADGESFIGICSALEAFGYQVETYGIPAACVKAWHERDRIWIVAYSNDLLNTRKLADRKSPSEETRGEISDERERQTQNRERIRVELGAGFEIIPNTYAPGLQVSTRAELRCIQEEDGTFTRCATNGAPSTIGGYWPAEPGVGRVVHGVPNRVDRIKGLGNAIVPQVAFEIFKVIEMIKDKV